MLSDGSPPWPEIRVGDTGLDWDPRFSWADGTPKDRIWVSRLNDLEAGDVPLAPQSDLEVCLTNRDVFWEKCR